MQSISRFPVSYILRLKQQSLTWFVCGCICLLCFSASAVTWAADRDSSALGVKIKKRYAQQRQSYIELSDLVSAGQRGLASDRTNELKNYPLAGHLDYLLLRQAVDSTSTPKALLHDADNHLQQYSDDRAHRRLLGGLKNRAVKLERWADYATIALADNAPRHPCDDLLSRVKNDRINSFAKAEGELWATPAKHTKNCDAAFAAIIKQVGDVPTRALWQRSVALLVRGQGDQARELLSFYNRRDRAVVEQWINNIDEPEKLIKSSAMVGKTEHHRRLVKHVLRRWARDDLAGASAFWAQSGGKFGFNAADIAKTTGDYAVLAAKRGMSEAAEMLESANGSHRGVRYWRVRMALRDKNWRAAVLRIEQLTSKEQQSNRWQYWRARSLAELGYTGAAEKIYRKLSANFDYHGFLASDRLGIAYQIDVSEPRATEAAVDKLLDDPQIAMALEFFLVDIGWEGRRVWNNALRDANDEQLIAAAQIALAVGWYDRAYATIKRTGYKSALAYLFPTPHPELVAQTSALNSVPNAFVYGVIRQESGFIPDVKSPAGAVGLMQLMPTTARDMGKKLGVSAPAWKLIDSELNIRLGIKYLNFVLQRFDDNAVLAAAAYNAGPHRVRQWLGDDTLPADIWVETIPFDETRDYVRGVLFNTTVSEWRLQNGALTRLRTRMPDVLPLG